MHYHQLHTMHLQDDADGKDDDDDGEDDDGDVDDGDGEDGDDDGDDDDDDPGKATGLGLFLFHMSKVSQLQMDDNSMEKWGEIQ